MSLPIAGNLLQEIRFLFNFTRDIRNTNNKANTMSSTASEPEEKTEGGNFIIQKIEADLKAGKNGGRVQTR